MNSENVKKIYVLNLDKTRLGIISGLVIIGLAGSFLLGLKFQTPQQRENVDKTTAQFNPSTLTDIQPETPKNDNILTIPEEDTQIFSKNAGNSDDPFLDDPPVRIKKSSKIQLPGKNKKSIERKSYHKPDNQVSTKLSSNKAYYTVQIGAFVHEKDAKKLTRDLRKKGIDARVDKGTLYYFVRTGKAAKKDSLEPVFQKLSNKMKFKAIIIQKKIS